MLFASAYQRMCAKENAADFHIASTSQELHIAHAEGLHEDSGGSTASVMGDPFKVCP